jgi:hypothetical protein
MCPSELISESRAQSHVCDGYGDSTDEEGARARPNRTSQLSK